MSKRTAGEVTLRSYVIGFVVSLLLTLTAYLVVAHHGLNRHGLLFVTAVLAVTQFFVQMVYFLHITVEKQPRWKLLVFGFMTLVVLILVFGSLWIMTNLNYRQTPDQINKYLQQQDGGI